MDEKEIYENYSGLGMSAPTNKHQHIIDLLGDNFQKRFKVVNFLRGVAVIDDPERIPDITFYRLGADMITPNNAADVIMTVEIVHTSNNLYYSRKSIEDTFAHLPSLREAFMYDYESKLWTRYARESNGEAEWADTDLSLTFGIHLGSLIDNDEFLELTDSQNITVGVIERNIHIRFPKYTVRNMMCLHSSPRISADISLFGNYGECRNVRNVPILAINVTYTSSEKSYAIQCAEAAVSFVPSLKEFFIYDKDGNEWTRVSNYRGTVVTERGKDFSRALDIYLHTLTKGL